MYKNYLIIALRNLWKHKAFSLINIGGLAIGMTACLMIFHYVSFEWSYDKFHKNLPNLYRIAFENYNDGVYQSTSASTVSGLAPAIKTNIPGLTDYCRIHPIKGVMSSVGKDGKISRFNENSIYYADPSFLSMFSFPLKMGTVNAALAEPNTAVLTETTALRYFGQRDPIGKTITLGQNETYTVLGVLQDLPKNSHFEFDLLLSYRSLGIEQDENWTWSGDYTYLQLNHDIDASTFEQKLATIVASYHSKDSRDRYLLQPIEDIYLHSSLERELSVNGSAKMVYFLGLVALLTLAIAWFNNINLTIANSFDRSKEVGIRKVIGARRLQLTIQFLLDAVILNAMAMVLSILLIGLGSTFINSFLKETIAVVLWDDAKPWIVFCGLFFIGILISGIYPSLVQSGFAIEDALKTRVKQKSEGFSIRKALIAFQFAVSVLLLIAVFTVFRQMEYMLNADLGIDLEQTLLIKKPNITDQNTAGKFAGFKDELLGFSQINSVTFSSAVPGELIDWHRSDIKLGRLDSDLRYSIAIIGIDHDFREAFGLRMLAGVNFQPSTSASSAYMIINQQAVKHFGFKNNHEALDKDVFIGDRHFEVIGVINDYHHLSLKELVQPILYIAGSTRQPNYAIKVSNTNLASTIDMVQDKWEAVYPGNIFEYFFLDDFFNQQYKSDRQLGKIIGIFSGIATLVACLGLFGLVLYTLNQRTKEIGVRKVLGASITNIWILFSKGYLKLIVTASLVITPLAFLGIRKWLANYAYQIDIDAWLFIIPVLAILMITLFTISFQIIKVALTSPVDSLRYE